MRDERRSIGRYAILEVLGRGGFATVYLVRDAQLDREVALKLLHPHLAEDDTIRHRFLTEVRAIARLKHPNIVTVYETGEIDDQPYYTMEYIDGSTLTDVLTPERQLPLQEVIDLFGPLCGAVGYLHQVGIVHRDIKPANIMRSRTGRVLLMDFGIARVLEQTQFTQSGVTLGTPAYMAPEQALGEPITAASDIYSLGIVAYQMLAGRPPFRGATAQVLHAQAYEPPPDLRGLRPGLPDGVYTAVTAALAKDPAARPATSVALAEALSGGAAPATPVPPTQAATTVLAPVGRADPRPADNQSPTAQDAALPPPESPVPAADLDSEPEPSADLVAAETSRMPAATPSKPPAPGRKGLSARRKLLSAGAVAAAVLLAGVAGVVVYAQRGSGTHSSGNNQPPPTAPAAPAATQAQPVTITEVMTDYAFSAPTITVPAGAQVTITLSNQGTRNHSFHVLTAGNEIKTPIYAPGTGANYSLTVSTPGTWRFQCDVFPDRMQGTFKVQ